MLAASEDIMKLHHAGAADLETVMHHRRCTFREMGFQPTNKMRLALK
jgi:hypothetical protein